MSAAVLDAPARKSRAKQPDAVVPPARNAADFDIDAASLTLAHALSISTVLSMVFGRGTSASADELRALQGLMGSLQHLRRILADLQSEVMEVTGDLPDDFRSGLFEAAEMVALMDELEWLSGYKFHLGDDTMAEYFSAINSAIYIAREAINAPGILARIEAP